MVQQLKNRRVLRPAEPTPKAVDDGRNYAEPSSRAWAAFARDLTKSDTTAVRRFCADIGLPAEIAPALVVVQTEEKRLAAIVECDLDPDAATDLERELAIVQRMQPEKVEDATAVAKRMGELDKQIRAAKAKQLEREQAVVELDALRSVFAEILDNGKPGAVLFSGSSLPHTVRNALVAAGFDATATYHESWRLAYQKMVAWPRN